MGNPKVMGGFTLKKGTVMGEVFSCLSMITIDPCYNGTMLYEFIDLGRLLLYCDDVTVTGCIGDCQISVLLQHK